MNYSGEKMTIGQKGLTRIQELINPLIGQKAWNVSLGVGSFLTFEFGEKVKKTDERYAHGEWHLWIQFCEWILKEDKAVLAENESPRSEIRKMIPRLEGLRILSFKVNSFAETSIDFENEFSLQLKVSPFEEKGEDLWWLFMPDENVLKLNSKDVIVNKASEPN